MKKAIITNSAGAILAEFLLNPLCRSEYHIELNENFKRVLVVRNYPGGAVADSLEIGNETIKVIVKEC